MDENGVTKRDSNAMMILKASIALIVFARITVAVVYKDYNWEYAKCIESYASDVCSEYNVKMQWEEYDEWDRQWGDAWHEENEPLCVKDVNSSRDPLDWSLCRNKGLTGAIE